MKKNFLGKTGLEVTELCFGALPLGPLQANLSEAEGAKVIRAGLERGINFIDTAEAYQTYPHIRQALEGINKDVIIATKSAAAGYEEMEKSIHKALEGFDREYIDIFHLHAARVDTDVFEVRKGALQCLLDYKRKGVIRAVGISTHVVDVVNLAAEVAELDIVFPIINMIGMGIVGGSTEDMLKAIAKVHRAGKGMYAMKALAGGHLIDKLPQALKFAREIEGMSSIAVGMITEQELELNLKLFDNEEVSPEVLPQKSRNKKLLVSRFCKGCGTCVETCPNSALSLKDGQAVVDHTLCLMCGYCNPVCPEFALRLV